MEEERQYPYEKIHRRDTELQRAYDAAVQEIDGCNEWIKHKQEEINKAIQKIKEAEKIIQECIRRAKEQGVEHIL